MSPVVLPSEPRRGSAKTNTRDLISHLARLESTVARHKAVPFAAIENQSYFWSAVNANAIRRNNMNKNSNGLFYDVNAAGYLRNSV